MKEDSQKVFKYLLSLPFSDKQIIELLEILIEFRNRLENQRKIRFPFKQIDMYKWKSYFLIVKASSLGLKLSTNDVMLLLKIPPKYRRSIDDYLCDNGVIRSEKEEKPKDIKLEIAPLKRSIIKQARRGRPANVHEIDTDALLKLEKMLDKDMITRIFDLLGINRELKRLLKPIIVNDREEFDKLVKEIIDTFKIEIPSKSR
ncbi:MAG: hypothetical protein NTY20_02590 [Candidatus Aenigmarchaeota archaeon]|nr:hypothetical protein [Candidatus Aenigmarchaeota archaeon]